MADREFSVAFGRAFEPAIAVAVAGSLTPIGKLTKGNPDWLWIPDYLNWQGDWVVTGVYDDRDVVLYRDGDLIHAFVSKQNHNIGNTPTTAYAWWTRLIQENWNK